MTTKRDSIKKLTKGSTSMQSTESAGDLVTKHRQNDECPSVQLNRRKITECNIDQDLSRIDNVRVVCRFRPPSAREVRWSQKYDVQSDVPVIEDSKVVTVTRPPHKETPCKSTRKTRKAKFFRTCLDDVLGTDTSQKEIFKLVGQPVVLSCLEGYNNTIFAYGQSGSGKTYTMFGPESRHSSIDHFGIVPRCFIYIFQKLNESLSSNGGHLQEYKVELQLLQIYKSEIRDLLNPHSSTKLVIKTDFNNDSVHIQNLRSLLINNVEEAFAVLTEGQSNRIVSGHKLNATSSRSHMLVMANIEQRSVDGSILQSKLNFGDLAGSENITKSLGQHTDFESREESIAINSSLSALTTVMTYLSKGKRPSYRENPLTHILKDSLGGNSKTVMFVACSPHIQNRGETIRTLRFASCAKKIKNAAKKNKEQCKEFLKRRVKDLEGELLKVEAQLLEEKNRQRALARHVSHMCSVSNRRSGTTITIDVEHPADPDELGPLLSGVQHKNDATQSVVRMSQSLLQSVTQSIACGTDGSQYEHSTFAVASSNSGANDTEDTKVLSVIAVDTLLTGDLDENEEYEDLNDQNTHIINDLRKHLDSVMEDNKMMRIQIMNKNMELRMISDRADRLESVIQNQIKGLVEAHISVTTQRSFSKGMSRCGSQRGNDIRITPSDHPTVTDDDFDLPPEPPLPPDTRSPSRPRPVGDFLPLREDLASTPIHTPSRQKQELQDSISRVSLASSIKSNQLLPPTMIEKNTSAQKLNTSNTFQFNYENTRSGRRSSALQSKLLHYLRSLQQQVEVSPFKDFSRQTSVFADSQPPEPQSQHKQGQTNCKQKGGGGRRVSISSAAGGDDDILDDAELEELMRLNNSGGKRFSALSTASSKSMASKRDSINDKQNTRRRQKMIVQRRRKEGQIRRASAPMCISSLMDLESCIIGSPDAMLTPINERSTILGRSSQGSTEEVESH